MENPNLLTLKIQAEISLKTIRVSIVLPDLLALKNQAGISRKTIRVSIVFA